MKITFNWFHVKLALSISVDTDGKKVDAYILQWVFPVWNVYGDKVFKYFE